MVNIIDWAPSVLGRLVKAPMGEGGQCVDLAVLWCQANRLPRVWANAAEWSKQYDPHYWHLIFNSPTNAPKPGELIIWHENAAVDVGPDGHIAVCLAATPDTIISLDQNWPEGTGVHVQTHGYQGVVGWLTPLLGRPTSR